MEVLNCPLVQIYYLIGNILYFKLRHNINSLISSFLKLYLIIKRLSYCVYSVPDEFLHVILNVSGCYEYLNNTFILFGPRPLKPEWYEVRFVFNSKHFMRNVCIAYSPCIPSNTIICSKSLLHNIKQYLKIPLYQKPVLQLRFTKLTDFVPKEAVVLKTSLVNSSINVEPALIEKGIAKFVSRRQFIYLNDLIVLDFHFHDSDSPLEFMYFKVVEVSVDSSLVAPLSSSEGSAVSGVTSVYQGGAVNSFVPYCSLTLLKRCSIPSVIPVLPLGFKRDFSKLVRWLEPFFSNVVTVSELKPIFILTGANGIGKALLLEAAAQKMGVHYLNVDCNNLIGNTGVQMQANINTAMSRIRKIVPAVVHLSNISLLCADNDGCDTDQMITSLCHALTSAATSPPAVFVFTCEDINSLTSQLVASSLQHHHMELPTDSDRYEMLIWLAVFFRIHIPDGLLDELVVQTSSYSFSDLKKLISLAIKEKRKIGMKGPTTMQHFKPVLELMCKTDKGSVGQIEWSDVGGVEEIKKAIMSSVQSVHLGGLKRTGLLLYGPPGTGKTLLARVVARQCSAAFIPVKGPELLNMYVGQSEANIREVFRKAKDAAPCILFFDELDSLAPNRGNKSDSGGVMDRVVSQLLAEMDNLETDDVFILAATNRPDLIDPALLRPGRLDKKLYVGPCSEYAEKLKVFKAVTRKFIFEGGFNETEIIRVLPQEVTGAQVYAISYAAWMGAARELIETKETDESAKVVVGSRHFQDALRSMHLQF